MAWLAVFISRPKPQALPRLEKAFLSAAKSINYHVLMLMDGLPKSTPNFVQRVKGIEPSSVAWKATALPLSYTRVRAPQNAVPACSCQVLFPWHRDLPIPAVASSTLL
jgi:hypothetical protein